MKTTIIYLEKFALVSVASDNELKKVESLKNCTKRSLVYSITWTLSAKAMALQVVSKGNSSKEKKMNDEEIRPNGYFQIRTITIANLKAAGTQNSPYPHKFHVSTSLEEFIEKNSHLNDAEQLEQEQLSVVGRVL